MELPELIDIQKELSRRSYYEYLKFAHNGQYKDIRHGKFIADKLQEAVSKRRDMLDGLIPRKKQLFIFTLPPRHSKSMTITESYPSYFLGNFPNDRVILLSYGDDLAKRFSKRNIQKVDQHGKSLFGIELDDKSRSMSDWDIKDTRGWLHKSWYYGRCYRPRCRLITDRRSY